MDLVKKLRVISVILATSVTLVSCATDQAAKMRTDKKTTVGVVGLGLGALVEYRPSAGYGVDLAFQNGSLGLPGRFTFASLFEDSIRELDETDLKTYTLAGTFYPWQNSAFRVGAGLTSTTGNLKFDAFAVDENSASQKVKYSYSSNYLVIPVGWNWIFESLGGFTYGLSYDLMFEISNSTSMKDGGTAAIDTADRDAYLNEYKNDRKRRVGGMLSHIGWSF
jgi:hypothetical protein